jgi:hypothetical protein
MAKHLWHEHGLVLVRGKTRNRARMVDAIRREYAALGDPALFDNAVAIGGEAAVGVWAADTASEEEALPICADAGARGASVCPVCFGFVPPAVPEVPPLAVAGGRLAGDGFVAVAPVARPRVTATIAAAVVLVAVTVFVHVSLGFVCAIVAYFVALLASWPRGAPEDRAVDAAWRKLAPRLADRRDAARFLARLCVTSAGRGDPFERANTLQRVIARARDNPAERQLLAPALALQVDDAAKFGRDRAAGIADLVAMAFRGEQPADFAEFVLTACASGDVGERARLRVRLYAAAFAAGLSPHAVIDLCGAAPQLAGAMRLPPFQVALLYGVWVHSANPPWAPLGGAQTVFELTATSPATAARLLSQVPGLLLVCATPPNVLAELGPVLVTAGGVSVGGTVVSDPAADVRVETGGLELVFGKKQFRLTRAVPEEFAEVLKAWLKFRAEVFAAYPAAYLPTERPPESDLLAPFVARCPECGTECTPIVGAIARPLRA